MLNKFANYPRTSSAVVPGAQERVGSLSGEEEFLVADIYISLRMEAFNQYHEQRQKRGVEPGSGGDMVKYCTSEGHAVSSFRASFVLSWLRFTAAAMRQSAHSLPTAHRKEEDQGLELYRRSSDFPMSQR
jgi:hypothetical protein